MDIILRISKALFDEAVPVAKEPKGVIFGKMENKINERIKDIAVDKLGDVAIDEVNGNLKGKLAVTVASLASVDTFLHEIRGLDLVLTGSGFGVVSSNDTAPASKMRVDAMEAELRIRWLMYYDDLMELCFKIPGWYGQGLVIIDTLFCFFKLLKPYAVMQAPNAKDWELSASPILETDRWLRNEISDEYMDELIGQMATNSLSADNRGIVHQIRRIIGAALQKNKGLAYEYFRRLINTLESDLEKFSTYAGSQAFEARHFKPYENTKEKSAFHFVG